MSTGRRTLASAAAAAALICYDALVRQWMRDWGSTKDERRMALPGDEVASTFMTHYTKGLTIDAPPEDVWPWLVQIGDRRAGFYSYDWVERFLFLGTVHYVERTHSATRIHPELQHPRVGDRINIGSVGKREVSNPITVMEPNRALVMGGWAFVLQPLPRRRTRLLVRDRDGGYLQELVPPKYVLPRLLLGAVDYLVGDPLHFAMERRMMLGLKGRAEQSRTARSTSSVDGRPVPHGGAS